MKFPLILICVWIGPSLAIPPPLLKNEQLSTTSGDKDAQSTGQITEPPKGESGIKVIDTRTKVFLRSNNEIIPYAKTFGVNNDKLESEREDKGFKIKDSSNEIASEADTFDKPKVTGEDKEVLTTALEYFLNEKLDDLPNKVTFVTNAPDIVMGKLDDRQPKKGNGEVTGVNGDLSETTVAGHKTIKIQGLNPLNIVMTLSDNKRLKDIVSKPKTMISRLHPAPDGNNKHEEKIAAINNKGNFNVFPYKHYFSKNGLRGGSYGTFPRISPVFSNKPQSSFGLRSPSFLFPQLSPIREENVYSKKEKEAKSASSEKTTRKMIRKLAKQQSEIKWLILQLADRQADIQDSVDRIEQLIPKYSEDYVMDSRTPSSDSEEDHYYESSANSYSRFKYL